MAITSRAGAFRARRGNGMAALAQSIRRSAIGLGLFAIITGGTIALTQQLTRDRIQEQVARAEAGATVTLPPGSRLAIDGPLKGWVARQDGEPVGMILPAVAPDGYSGDIHLLVGIDLQGEVLGVRVTSHRETPGLGDRVELRKSNWVLSFEGRSLKNPEPRNWEVKKNGGVFDQFTGATITPSAVVNTVQDTLVYFREHREAILTTVSADNIHTSNKPQAHREEG